jgi:hypothetical protein
VDYVLGLDVLGSVSLQNRQCVINSQMHVQTSVIAEPAFRLVVEFHISIASPVPPSRNLVMRGVYVALCTYPSTSSLVSLQLFRNY